MSMQFQPGMWYHVYNRGNNRIPIYIERGNYLFFLEKVRTHWLHHCKIIAYALMPNHFHFLIKVNEKYKQQDLNNAIAVTLRSYTRAINKRFGRTGSLFQEGTKAKPLNHPVTRGNADKRIAHFQSPGEWSRHRVEYPLICFHYIHQNPVRAGLAKDLQEWEFSSYREYAGLRNGTLPDIVLGYQTLGFENVPDFVRQSKLALHSPVDLSSNQ